MIEIACSACGDELERKGWLLVLPPSEEWESGLLVGDVVVKLHLCGRCGYAALSAVRRQARLARRGELIEEQVAVPPVSDPAIGVSDAEFRSAMIALDREDRDEGQGPEGV